MSDETPHAPSLVQSPLLGLHPGVRHAFSTRGSAADGLSFSVGFGQEISRDQANRSRRSILAAMGRPEAAWISVHQMHGDTIVQVTSRASHVIQADGLWTRDRAAAVAVLTADCLPVLMTDKRGTFVAAVHAGWRGTRARIVARMVERLHGQGIAPGELLVALGPAIGPCCFEIGQDVVESLAQAFPASPEALREVAGRKVADLWALNRVALVEAGVPAESIDELRLCTSCDERFFSHRRDQGKTGRQAGVIALAAGAGRKL